LDGRAEVRLNIVWGFVEMEVWRDTLRNLLGWSANVIVVMCGGGGGGDDDDDDDDGIVKRAP